MGLSFVLFCLVVGGFGGSFSWFGCRGRGGHCETQKIVIQTRSSPAASGDASEKFACVNIFLLLDDELKAEQKPSLYHLDDMYDRKVNNDNY